MRAALLFAAFVALGACTSSPAAPPEVDGGNGANSALGTTCNPKLAGPCEQPSDACSIAVCDPKSLVCVRVAVDAGPACTSGNPACPSGECDAAAEASDAAVEGGRPSDGGDAGVFDGSNDATTDGESDGDSDAATDAADASSDAPSDAGDSGD
jgi:hypothetical protein